MNDRKMGAGYRPAKGLKKLTWTQVEQLDEAIAQLCALSQEEKTTVELTIVIRNGHPRVIKQPLVWHALSPIP